MSTEVGIIVVAGALVAGTLQDRLVGADPVAAIVETPTVSSRPEMSAPVATFSLGPFIPGVWVHPDDAPPPPPGGVPQAPITAQSTPARWFSGQVWALRRTFGSYPAVLSADGVPRLTYRQASAWIAVWERAIQAWEAVIATWHPTVDQGASPADIINAENYGSQYLFARSWVDAAESAIASLRRLSWPSTDEPSLFASLLTYQRIREVAIALTRGAVSMTPEPLDYWVYGTDRILGAAGDAVSAVGSAVGSAVAGVAGAAAGAAADLAIGLVGRVVTSPAGAALLLAGLWWTVRR